MDKLSAHILISGVVQGVGFRPFLNREMKKLQLCGEICNTSEGVEILLEGAGEEIDAFIDSIQKNAPPLASVNGITCKKNKMHIRL